MHPFRSALISLSPRGRGSGRGGACYSNLPLSCTCALLDVCPGEAVRLTVTLTPPLPRPLPRGERERKPGEASTPAHTRFASFAFNLDRNHCSPTAGNAPDSRSRRGACVRALAERYHW